MQHPLAERHIPATLTRRFVAYAADCSILFGGLLVWQTMLKPITLSSLPCTTNPRTLADCTRGYSVQEHSRFWCTLLPRNNLHVR